MLYSAQKKCYSESVDTVLHLRDEFENLSDCHNCGWEITYQPQKVQSLQRN